jgi:hypothetical protein
MDGMGHCQKRVHSPEEDKSECDQREQHSKPAASGERPALAARKEPKTGFRVLSIQLLLFPVERPAPTVGPKFQMEQGEFLRLIPFCSRKETMADLIISMVRGRQ